MDPDDKKMLIETHRLALENNKMLHRMRRAVWVRMVVWLIIYGAVIAAPIWFYMTYLDGAVRNLFHAYDQIQGAGQATESKYENFKSAVQNLESKIPGMNSSEASSSPEQ